MKIITPSETIVLTPALRWFGLGTFIAVVAGALFVFWPNPRAVELPRAVVAAAETPAEILARIPRLPAESEAGKALKLASEKVLAAPGSADAWIRLGESLAQAQRSTGGTAFFDHAETACRRALALSPRSAAAMTGLAWVYGGRHRFSWSIEWAQRALDVDSGYHAAHGILGDAALEMGDYGAAFEHYQTMMDLRPDLSSWSRGAYLLWITGHKTEGIALMERAIRSGAPFAENTAWCRARLATMLLHDGALLPAAQALAPALKSAPGNLHVLLAAGRIATAREDFAGARRHFEKMLEQGPHHDALVALGDLCLVQGGIAAAEEYFGKVEALHAVNRAAGAHDHTSMAKFFADHGRQLDEALRLAGEHDASASVLEADVLAWVCYQRGDLARATAAMKKALSQNTPDPELHFHAGMIAAAAGDRVAARKHLQTALALNPRFHPLHAPVARNALAELSASRNSTAR